MIRFPKSYIKAITKFCSDKCNANCSYCFHQGKFNIDKDTSLAKSILSTLKTDVVFNGAGEPTLGLDIIEDIRPFVRGNIYVLTNGSNPDIVNEYLSKYDNFYFIQTIGCQHKYPRLPNHKRIMVRHLISPDTNLDEIDITDSNTEFQFLFKKDIKLDGSILDKSIERNPKILERIMDITSWIYGFRGCHDTAMSTDAMFCVAKPGKLSSLGIRQWIAASKDMCYDFLQEEKYLDHCDIVSGLYREIVNKYGPLFFPWTQKDFVIRFYQAINAQKINEDAEIIDVSVDLNEIYSDTPFEYKDMYWATRESVISLYDLPHGDGAEFVTVKSFFNSLYNITFAGFKEDIRKLFSHPDKYRLRSKYETRIFKQFIQEVS